MIDDLDEIEAVAKAMYLAENSHQGVKWRDEHRFSRRKWRFRAKAAIRELERRRK